MAGRLSAGYIADGNRFIDYMGAYGPNILGFNDPEVDEAAPG